MRVAPEPDARGGEAGRPAIHFGGWGGGRPRLACRAAVATTDLARGSAVLAILLAVAACGPAPDPRAGRLELGVELEGLGLAPDEYLCTTWAVYQKKDGPDEDEWDPGRSRRGDREVCGDRGKGHVDIDDDVRCHEDCRFQADYDVRVCKKPGSGKPQPCGSHETVHRSKKSHHGKCKPRPPSAKVKVKITVDQVCWNYKLDVGTPASANEIQFGLLMGPDDCATGSADSYCILGHPLATFVPREHGTLEGSPEINYVLTNAPRDGSWELFFLSFDGGEPPGVPPELGVPGLHLYNAPWLLEVWNDGVWDPATSASHIVSFNRGQESVTPVPDNYRTVGSWLYNPAGIEQNPAHLSVGFITAGLPRLAADCQGQDCTVLVWDATPNCNADADGDANLQWFKNPHHSSCYEVGCSRQGERAYIGGVVSRYDPADCRTKPSQFAIVYVCAMPKADEDAPDLSRMGAVLRLDCDAAGLAWDASGHPTRICECETSAPVWDPAAPCPKPKFKYLMRAPSEGSH